MIYLIVSNKRKKKQTNKTDIHISTNLHNLLLPSEIIQNKIHAEELY
jgi:hypothetical protein